MFPVLASGDPAVGRTLMPEKVIVDDTPPPPDDVLKTLMVIVVLVGVTV
jgi:hypothetical protein